MSSRFLALRLSRNRSSLPRPGVVGENVKRGAENQDYFEGVRARRFAAVKIDLELEPSVLEPVVKDSKVICSNPANDARAADGFSDLDARCMNAGGPNAGSKITKIRNQSLVTQRQGVLCCTP